MEREIFLNTGDMAYALDLTDTDRVTALCRCKEIPAWRIPPNGSWRIDADTFRKYLQRHRIPTERLDRVLDRKRPVE